MAQGFCGWSCRTRERECCHWVGGTGLSCVRHQVRSRSEQQSTAAGPFVTPFPAAGTSFCGAIRYKQTSVIDNSTGSFATRRNAIQYGHHDNNWKRNTHLVSSLGAGRGGTGPGSSSCTRCGFVNGGGREYESFASHNCPNGRSCCCPGLCAVIAPPAWLWAGRACEADFGRDFA